jgi:tyrosyl-tRNA synthetase
MLSVYDYWQFWRNTEDADVERFLRLFTELPLDEIEQLAALEGAELNEAKKILATRATAMAHGEDAAQAALKTATDTFEAGSTSANLPSVSIPRDQLANTIGILEALVLVEFASSNGDARRLVQGGGAKVNDKAVTDFRAVISLDDLIDDAIKISAGKKRHALLKPTD